MYYKMGMMAAGCEFCLMYDDFRDFICLLPRVQFSPDTTHWFCTHIENVARAKTKKKISKKMQTGWKCAMQMVSGFSPCPWTKKSSSIIFCGAKSQEHIQFVHKTANSVKNYTIYIHLIKHAKYTHLNIYITQSHFCVFPLENLQFVVYKHHHFSLPIDRLTNNAFVFLLI